jgi:phosphatidylglycerophosphate synthase
MSLDMLPRPARPRTHLADVPFANVGRKPTTPIAHDERARAANYPLSRWWLRPAAGWLAVRLNGTRVRPWHLTLCGLMTACIAAAVIVHSDTGSVLAAGLVFLVWFFDRADGQLARRQGTASARGGWLDANIDELIDVGLQAAVACAVWRATGAVLPIALLAAFLAGKHLLMHGLATEEHFHSTLPQEEGLGEGPARRTMSLVQRLYHMPANADVRVYLLAACLAGGWLTAELAIVAAYYGLRGLARFVLVCRRLPGVDR